MAWHAATYLAFADHRTRPAYELIARVALKSPRVIYDLGCGPGNSTNALAARWPDAALIGVDNSPEMLETARKDGPKIARWQLADLADWAPLETPSLIFSNATLQWLPGQEQLLPRLLGLLDDGGVFAFQVPANHTEPPHTVIDEVLAELNLLDRIDPASLSRHVLPQTDYYQLLAPLAAALDIWDTTYLQVLQGEDAVLNWVKGTALVPIMAVLEPSESREFLALLRERLRMNYSRRPNGETLFPFRRRFIVAVR